eukprot:1960641-Rhodomonas_salina.1
MTAAACQGANGECHLVKDTCQVHVSTFRCAASPPTRHTRTRTARRPCCACGLRGAPPRAALSQARCSRAGVAPSAPQPPERAAGGARRCGGSTRSDVVAAHE